MIRKLALALPGLRSRPRPRRHGSRVAGSSRTAADPGVTATSILLGTTSPLSGSASAYASVARGADAYFKYVNSKGGVLGRKITNTILDDAYNPAQTVQATRKLVEQDKVFAIFNALGTEHNEATRDYLNANKVPQLFAASGATKFGTEAAQVPVHDRLPAELPGRGLGARQVPRADAGRREGRRLFQNDDYGKDLLNGLKKGIQRSKVQGRRGRAVRGHRRRRPGAGREAQGVGREHVRDLRDAEVRDPVLRLRHTAQLEAEADARERRLVGLEHHAARRRGRHEQGRQRLRLDRLPQGSDRSRSGQNDAAMKLYRQVMKQFAPGANANDVYHVYGMASAWTAVEALKKAGKNLTRAGLVKVVGAMNLSSNPFLLPGIALKTGPVRPLPDRADAAPALAEELLEELRGVVGVPSRLVLGRFPAAPERASGTATSRARASGPSLVPELRWLRRGRNERVRELGEEVAVAARELDDGAVPLDADVVARLDVLARVGDLEPVARCPGEPVVSLGRRRALAHGHGVAAVAASRRRG